MRKATSDKIYTVEEYIQHELSSEVRAEFFNGQLFEMSAEKDLNNELAGFFYSYFLTVLKGLGFLCI